jgi:hypothetical protein
MMQKKNMLCNSLFEAELTKNLLYLFEIRVKQTTVTYTEIQKSPYPAGTPPHKNHISPNPAN